MVLSRSSRVIVVGIVALLATACPGEPPADDPSGRSPRPGPSPVVGGTLRVLLAGDVDSLDPHMAARPSSWWFARALHRGLYAYPDEEGSRGQTPVPDLAMDLPAFSSDGLTATIRLREDVSFSDEQPLDARAVRASLQRLLRSPVGVGPALVVRPGVPGGLAAIDVVDERTVAVRLASASNDLVWLLAHPQAAIVPVGALPLPAAPEQLAGAGPYRLAAYRPERRIVLERNPSWSREFDPVRGAWADEIDARIGVDRAEARADLAAGTAHLIVDPGPPDAPAPTVPENARVERVVSTCTRYLFLDPRVAPFSRGALRLAVSHALDREAFVAGSAANAAPRLLPPTVIGTATAAVLAEDLGRARALLERAGRPRGFATEVLIGDSARDRRDAARVAAALERVGIRVTVRTVPPGALYPLHYDDPDERIAMGIATWCADWPGRAGRSVLMALADPGSLGEQRVPARPGAGGASVRAAIAAALRAPDGSVGPRWAEADAAVVGTGILIPLAWPDEEVVLGPGVRGWAGSPMFPRGDPTSLWLG